MRFITALIVLFLTIHTVADIHTSIGERVKSNLQQGIYQTGEQAKAKKEIEDNGNKLKIGVRYYVKEKFNCEKNWHGKESCIKAHLVIQRNHKKYIMWIPPKGKNKAWLDDQTKLTEKYMTNWMILKIYKVTATNKNVKVWNDEGEDMHAHYKQLYKLYNADKWWGDGAWLIMNPDLDISGLPISFGSGLTKKVLQWANELWKRYGVKQAYITDDASLLCESTTALAVKHFLHIKPKDEEMDWEEERLFRVLRVFEDKTTSIYNCGGYKNIRIYQSAKKVKNLSAARDKLRKMKFTTVAATLDSDIKETFLKAMKADKNKYFKSNAQSKSSKTLTVADLIPTLTVGEALLAVKGPGRSNAKCNDYVNTVKSLKSQSDAFGKVVGKYARMTNDLVLLNIDKKSEEDFQKIYTGFKSKYKPLEYINDKSTAAQENYYNYMDTYDFDNNDAEYYLQQDQYHDGTMSLVLIGIVVVFCVLCVCALVGAISGFLFAYYLGYYQKQSETIEQ